MKSISILGTSSDSGKSTLTFVIAKLLQRAGYSVAPFKAQNVSNNAFVCDDGSEIAVAQYFQATVLNIPTSYHLNPVLLKSSLGSSATLIVEGKVQKISKVKEYYADIDKLKPIVKRSFEYLSSKYDVLVCEGAGSPVELNLMDKDLSNIYVAKEFGNKIILVADIERGGVFASIYGVYNLLPEKLRSNVIGVIVNKFRGDMSLFDEGVRIIEEEFKIPVLGVLPYTPFNLGFEDGASLTSYAQNVVEQKLKIAVISYPYMSNFNDIEPLIADEEVIVEFISSNVTLENYDLTILPGSKLVIKDLQWLQKNGLFKQLQTLKKSIYGICGGFQMMFKSINDLKQIEHSYPLHVEALNFIDDEIIFQKEKLLKKGSYRAFNVDVNGFEIHHGVSKKFPIWFKNSNISGSFIHQIFDNNSFRTELFKTINPSYSGYDFDEYKNRSIDNFVNKMSEHIDMRKVLNVL